MQCFLKIGLGVALAGFFTVAGAEAGDKPVLGLANPASTYCTRIGGRLTIRKDKAGNETGYCRLRDGRLCEEWALFRDDKCVRPPKR